MKKVVLYVSNKCPHCENAKKFLEQNKVTFRLCNVQSPSGQKEFRRLNFRSVPVLKVSEQYLQGFSVKAYQAILK